MSTDTPKPPASGESESYYFGCWGQAGHYYFAPGMRSVRHESTATPWGLRIDSETFAKSKDWHVEKLDGWTAVGRTDNTVDRRPGSHSTFAFHADLTLDEAVTRARATFPEIFQRTGW